MSSNNQYTANAMRRAFRILAAVIALIGGGLSGPPAHSCMTLTGAGGACGGTPPPSFTGPCDTAAGATVFYGFVSCSAAYASAHSAAADICDVATCTTTATINFLSTGYWDAATAAASSACATACKVSKFYDSSGNANPAPVVTTNYGAINFNVLGTCSAATNIAASQFKYQSGAISVSQPYSLVTIGERTGGTGNVSIIAGGVGGGGTGLGLNSSANTGIFYSSETISTGATIADNAFHAFIGKSVSGAGSSSLTIDGAATTGTQSGNTITAFIVGSDPFSEPISGFFVAGGIWPSAVTASSMNTTLHALCGGF